MSNSIVLYVTQDPPTRTVFPQLLSSCFLRGFASTNHRYLKSAKLFSSFVTRSHKAFRCLKFSALWAAIFFRSASSRAATFVGQKICCKFLRRLRSMTCLQTLSTNVFMATWMTSAISPRGITGLESFFHSSFIRRSGLSVHVCCRARKDSCQGCWAVLRFSRHCLCISGQLRHFRSGLGSIVLAP